MGHLVINRVKVVHKDDLRVSDRILQSVSVSELMNEGAISDTARVSDYVHMYGRTAGVSVGVRGGEKKKKRIAFNSAE